MRARSLRSRSAVLPANVSLAPANASLAPANNSLDPTANTSLPPTANRTAGASVLLADGGPCWWTACGDALAEPAWLRWALPLALGCTFLLVSLVL
eukprot:3860900-Prymnesium_polylepis.1